MKKRLLLFIAAVLTLGFVVSLSACREARDSEIDNFLDQLEEGYNSKEVISVKSLKQGDELLVEEKITYNVQENGNLLVSTVKKELNSDPMSEDLYVETNDEKTVPNEDVRKTLPNLDKIKDEDFNNEGRGDYTLEDIDGDSVLTFKPKSVKDFLGFTDEEVKRVTNLSVSVKTTSGKVSSVEVTYNLDKVKKVQISVTFKYE